MRLSDAEWRLMEILWDRPGITARELMGLLPPGTDWAYTTVKTMLTRLAEKGAVVECRELRASAYTPAITRREARRGAVEALVSRAFGGTFGTLLTHLVREERLSEADRAELRRLLEDESAEHAGG